MGNFEGIEVYFKVAFSSGSLIFIKLMDFHKSAVFRRNYGPLPALHRLWLADFYDLQGDECNYYKGNNQDQFDAHISLS